MPGILLNGVFVSSLLAFCLADGPRPAGVLQPTAFVENQGQWPSTVKFLARRGEMLAQFEEGAVILGRRGKGAARLVFEGSARGAQVLGEEPVPWRYNFFLGNDSSRWRSDVRGYRSILCADLYPGVGVRFRDEGFLEYDLILEPGARLEQVVVRCEGARSLSLGPGGSLVIETDQGPLRQRAPLAWHEIPAGGRRRLDCRYRLLGGTRFGFLASGADADLRLVIDPIVEWVASIGAEGADYPLRNLILAPSGEGWELLAGGTGSCPTTCSWPPGACVQDLGQAGDGDALLVRLDPETGSLRSLTFFGGDGDDGVTAVKMDREGRILLAGYTASTDFPVVQSDTAFHGDVPGNPWENTGSPWDAFLVRLDADGCGLTYATYLGSPLEDAANSLQVEEDGSVLVFGFTESEDFPVTDGAFQSALAGGYDYFIARLRPDQGAALKDQLVYSTFFGGSGDETWRGDPPPDIPSRRAAILYQRINAWTSASDADGKLIVAGHTRSRDLGATAGAFDETFSGPTDAFVARLDLNPNLPAREQRLYLTFLGGEGWLNFPDVSGEAIVDMALDPRDGVWVTGRTDAADFPTTEGAWRSPKLSPMDVFVSHLKLDPLLGEKQLVYSARVGGSDWDRGASVSVNAKGVLTLAGHTFSTDFPITRDAPLQALQTGAPIDAFLLRLKPDPALSSDEQLLFSTFFGGEGLDTFHGLVEGPPDRFFVSLFSDSVDLVNVEGEVPHGEIDAHFLRLDLRLPQACFTVEGPPELMVTVDATCSTTPDGTTIVSYEWDFGDGATAGGIQATHIYASPGSYPIRLTVTNDLELTSTKTQSITLPCPQGDTSPWMQVSIGEHDFPSGAHFEGSLKLCSGGRDIASVSDSFFFVYQEAAGDVTLTARVTDLAIEAAGGKAGLMLRESLDDPGSRHAAIVLQKQGTGLRLRWLDRQVTGEETSFRTDALVPAIPDAWLRLVRQGDEIAAYFSNDGVTWPAEPVNRKTFDDLPDQLYAGVAAAGREPVGGSRFIALQAMIEDQKLERPPPGLDFRRGDADGKDGLNLTDAVFLLGHLFLGGTAPGCLDAADANDDGNLNITDPIAVLGFLFLGDAAPAPPFPSCGADPTPEDPEIGCSTYAACP